MFAAGDVLTPADTNVSTNTTVALATQPANQPSTNYYSWGYPNGLSNEEIIAYGTVNTWLSRESGKKESQTSSGNLTGEDQDFGVYYNNYAISGGTMLFDSPVNTTYPNDICPKGWMIPYQYASSGKSFVGLIVSTYHVITAAENSANEISQERYNARAPMLHNFPLSLPLSGYVSQQNGMTGFQGVRAVWRNNLSAGIIGQGFVVFRVLSDAPFDISTSRGNSYNVGTPVRCVNK